MRENIDLTENRDFQRHTLKSVCFKPIDALSTQSIRSYYEGVFDVLNDTYYTEKDTGAIKQGNGEERRSKNWCQEFGMGNYCDCCGVEIKPYYNNSLCEKCDNRSSISTNEIFSNFI